VSIRTGHFTLGRERAAARARRLAAARRAVLTIATVACAAGCAAAPAAVGVHGGTSASQGASMSPSGTTSIAPAEDVSRRAPSRPAARTAGTSVPGADNCPMFPADNVWNTNISRLPVSSNSAAWLASMDSASTDLHPDFGPNEGGYPYGIPFTLVSSQTPGVHLTFQYASESYQGPYPFGPGTAIEGGQNAPLDTDRHAIMVNTSTCTLYELWQARYSASGSTAGSGAMWQLRSNALRPAGWTSADAAGLPILPGLLDYAQVQQAVRTGKPITHAIRFTADHTSAAYLWPARHEAGSGSVAQFPPMGARFRLKASFSVAGFCSDSEAYCRDAKAVLTEMQDYGLILADNGSNWYFQGTAYPQWPDDLVSLLKQIPASDFEAVDESCLMVSPNSARARGSAGCPVG
jgi:hypothetical protein